VQPNFIAPHEPLGDRVGGVLADLDPVELADDLVLGFFCGVAGHRDGEQCACRKKGSDHRGGGSEAFAVAYACDVIETHNRFTHMVRVFKRLVALRGHRGQSGLAEERGKAKARGCAVGAVGIGDVVSLGDDRGVLRAMP
jgi:hypothetical protein